MPTTITSAGITFNDATTLTSANITLADGAVTNAKIASNAVTVDKLGTTEQTRIAKAWVNFNGLTGVIRSSYNVSSVTKTNTGRYTINFSSAMTDTNYSISAFGGDAGTNSWTTISTPTSGSSPIGAGSIAITSSLLGNYADSFIVSVQIFGN